MSGVAGIAGARVGSDGADAPADAGELGAGVGGTGLVIAGVGTASTCLPRAISTHFELAGDGLVCPSLMIVPLADAILASCVPSTTHRTLQLISGGSWVA